MAVKKKEKAVQGAYVSIEVKNWIEKNFEKMKFHSPTDMAGSILEEYYLRTKENKKNKREKVQ
jgi:hypothetical protein